jgi:hypothetical protein
MSQTIITAGDASSGLVQAAGNDGTLVLQSGAAGAKVNAVIYAADGTPTMIKGPTIGSAPTPVPSGSAPLYGCRAWCVFDGTLTGTNAPTAGGNVTSVTRVSAGVYTINFTTAMSSANYAVTSMAKYTASGADIMHYSGSTAPTTTTVTINNYNTLSGSIDSSIISIAIFA